MKTETENEDWIDCNAGEYIELMKLEIGNWMLRRQIKIKKLIASGQVPVVKDRKADYEFNT